MAEHSIEPEEEKGLKELTDEELEKRKAELEEIETRAEDEGLTYHGSYEDVKVEKAVTSKGEGDNVKRDYYVCTVCSWINPLLALRCENCGEPRKDPRTGKIAHVPKYW